MATITGSPDITVKEIDLTSWSNSESGTTAALVGEFEWGPVESIRLIPTEGSLISTFAYPTDKNYKDWFTARNYLQYSNRLALVRVAEAGSRNASNQHFEGTEYLTKSKILIKNQERFNVMAFGDGDKSYDAKIVAKYPGIYGNNIRVCVLNRDGKIRRDTYNQATKTKFPNLIDNSAYLPRKWGKDDIVVGVFLWNSDASQWELKEYGTFSTNPESTDVNGYGNYVFDYFKTDSPYIYFIKEHWGGTAKSKSLKGEATTGASSKSFYRVSEDSYDVKGPIDIDVRLSGGYTQYSNWQQQSSISYVCYSTSGTDTINSVFQFAKFYDTKKSQIVIGKYVKTYTNGALNDEPQILVGSYSPSVAGKIYSDVDDSGSEKVYTLTDENNQPIGYYSESTPSYATYHLLFNDKDALDDDSQVSFVDTVLYYNERENNVKIGMKVDADFKPHSDDTVLRSSVYVTKETVTSDTAVATGAIAVMIPDSNILDDTDTDDSNNTSYYYTDSVIDDKNSKCYLLFVDEKCSDTADYTLDATTPQVATAEWKIISPEELEEAETADTTPYSIKEFFNITNDKVILDDNTGDIAGITTFAQMEYLPMDAEQEDVSVGDVYTFNLTNNKISAYKRGWDLFDDEETQFAQVQILMQGAGNVEIGQYIIDLAETRGDCIACVSPMENECISPVDCYIDENDSEFSTFDPIKRITTGSGLRYQESSYAFMDGNYKYQFDPYNGVYRWLPMNGDMGGLFAWIDANEAGPWISIGNHPVRDCVRLAFYPSKAERDVLWQFNVNPITNFRAEGNIVWGDWTRVNNTAFNFIGVRRCFLHMEREVKKISRGIMFGQNDEITATLFKDAVSTFLDLVQGGRGISEYGVYAGAEVTPVHDMDRGIFNAKILVKPIRSIRYVQLTFTAVRSDMSIEEAVVYD